jgi:Leucine-rich repeat (LRR) protein
MKIIIFSLFLLCCFGKPSYSQCNHPDYAGLMEIYNSLGGPDWTHNGGWKEGAEGTNCDPCSGWFGVNCINNRVVSIDLGNLWLGSSNNLSGFIPNINIENLVTLRLLGDINGPIPDFNMLTNLKELSISGNRLIGQIPDFNHFSNLNTLIISGGISGSIPDFSNLPSLNRLAILGDSLTGSIPDFSNIQQLNELYISGNSLTGSIPDFSNIQQLNELYIIRCESLAGIIPDFSNMQHLESMVIAHTSLTGNIPDFRHLPNLGFLILSFNNLIGEIPNFSNLPNLLNFYCSHNNLTGNIPSFVSNLCRFDASNNRINGSISIISENNLIYDISYNEVTGRIPDLTINKNPSFHVFDRCNKYLPHNSLGLLRFYEYYFDLSSNKFEGVIPNIIFHKDTIILWSFTVNIENNNLSGCYASDICNLLQELPPNIMFDFSLYDNPKLPWNGDHTKFCNDGLSQIGAPCDDGLSNTVDDQINIDCICIGMLVDTCLVTVYDTIMIFDTIAIYDTITVIDTIYTTITDTTFVTEIVFISVTDTLIINIDISSTGNTNLTNQIKVFPNPASSHMTIDNGNYLLMPNYQIRILNSMGQGVFYTPIEQREYFLDLMNWGGKGTYFMQIIDNTGVIREIKKIILQ